MGKEGPALLSHLRLREVGAGLHDGAHAEHVIDVLPLPPAPGQVLEAQQLLHDAEQALGARPDLQEWRPDLSSDLQG